MKRLFANDRGAVAVEFGLAFLPVMFFILGIIQTAYVLWADNLLHFAVDTAARCGAIGSTTPPCDDVGGMVTTATAVFQPLTGATFTNNATCSAGGTGNGLVGTYNVRFILVNLTLTANSCYPALS
jgi:Flp pilus assembly protein TadG